VNRGEIWWARPPQPFGSEPGFHRPVVIVQSDRFNRSRISTVIAVAITRDQGAPAEQARQAEPAHATATGPDWRHPPSGQWHRPHAPIAPDRTNPSAASRPHLSLDSSFCCPTGPRPARARGGVDAGRTRGRRLCSPEATADPGGTDRTCRATTLNSWRAPGANRVAANEPERRGSNEPGCR
jgi:hypothetical protein